MECPECHAKLSDLAKFCPECGAKLAASNFVANTNDSVISHSPGAGSVFSVNTAPTIAIVCCDNCENEIQRKTGD